MTLLDEVESSRRNIRSDGYNMSIGEVLNLYRDREIQIRPEFQRLFRWPLEKQSRLIESILLDIPLPPIFVAQREDGVWEVVDGLQRLSTILKFMGELRDESTGDLQSHSTLLKTKYLPSLEGMTYSAGERSFPNALRIHFKRARLDFRILLRESDEAVKYELFDRLNSGGVPTSAQEVRSAQLLMGNASFFEWLDKLRKTTDFSTCVPLTDRQLSEQYDLELVTRFFVLRATSESRLRAFPDIDTLLTDRVLEMAADGKFDRSANESVFRSLFFVLSSVGPEMFRKYDKARRRAVGAFSVSAYEATTMGIAHHIDGWEALGLRDREKELRRRVATLWQDEQFLRYSGAGIRATQRVPMMGPVGRKIFDAP